MVAIMVVKKKRSNGLTNYTNHKRLFNLKEMFPPGFVIYSVTNIFLL